MKIGSNRKTVIRVLSATMFCSLLFVEIGSASTPVVTYGTYFGGLGETAKLVTVAPTGEVIVVGTTTSQTLPGTLQAFQQTKTPGLPNNLDVFVAKFDAAGRTLLWATFLGGDGDDAPVSVAVDAAGEILIAGTTFSSNFPLKGLVTCPPFGTYSFFQKPPCTLSPATTYTDSPSFRTSFVAKLSTDGRTLLSSVRFPNLLIGTIAPDVQGGVYLNTESGGDALFLFHLAPSWNAIAFVSYIGQVDGSFTAATALAVDAVGNCYIYGGTNGGQFSTTTAGPYPTTSNALQTQYSNLGVSNASPNPVRNGFLLEIDPSGSKLLYGTYFGPKYADTTFTGIALVQGSVYVTGSTNAQALQQGSPGAYLVSAPIGSSGQVYGFVAKLTPGSSNFDSFSYLGSAGRKLIVGSTVHVLSGNLLLELGMPAFGLVTNTPDTAFTDFALANQSTWVVGSCYAGACVSGVPSSDAYQTQGAAQSMFLAQLTDLNISVASVVNAASLISGPLASGQLATIFGSLLGPSPGVSGQVVAGAFGTSAGGTRVFFDGIPAPVFYAGSGQINVSVPCALSGHSSTQLTVTYNGASSSPFTVPITPSSPGIFTINGSGLGQGAVFNQDFSLNGPTNPATRGSAIALFATGLPSSTCLDGQILQGSNTIAAVGGISNEGAQVLYAGQAPNSVSGLQQVNLTVPSDSATGPGIFLVLEAGGSFSRAGVTVAVK